MVDIDAYKSFPFTLNMFNTNVYNHLSSVSDADALFNKELASAGITRNQLFSQLAPLFVGTDASRYAACLIHHHYNLKPGELMVARKLSTKPLALASTRSWSDSIIAQCWLRTGDAIEYRIISDPSKSTLPPPPTADLFKKFRSLLDPLGIDVLGICYADDELEDGFISQELDGPGDRERILTVIHRSARKVIGSDFEVMWIPKYNKEGQLFTMTCCSNCTKGCRKTSA